MELLFCHFEGCSAFLESKRAAGTHIFCPHKQSRTAVGSALVEQGLDFASFYFEIGRRKRLRVGNGNKALLRSFDRSGVQMETTVTCSIHGYHSLGCLMSSLKNVTMIWITIVVCLHMGCKWEQLFRSVKRLYAILRKTLKPCYSFWADLQLMNKF